MATMPELVVSVKVRLSLWGAIKLRIAGLTLAEAERLKLPRDIDR